MTIHRSLHSIKLLFVIFGTFQPFIVIAVFVVPLPAAFSAPGDLLFPRGHRSSSAEKPPQSDDHHTFDHQTQGESEIALFCVTEIRVRMGEHLRDSSWNRAKEAPGVRHT